MHGEKDHAADRHRNAARDHPEPRPAQARHHERDEADLALVPQQINTGQTANRRQPIDAVKLHMSEPGAVATGFCYRTIRNYG